MGGSETEVFYTLLVFIGVLLSVKIVQWFKHSRTLPPGPWGVPILGYLPFIKGATHLHFDELAKKFGSIFSIRLGSELIVVLSDYRIIRDSFRREEFSGRPHTDFMNILDGYGKCWAHSNGYALSRDFSTLSYRRGGLKHSADSLCLSHDSTFLFIKSSSLVAGIYSECRLISKRFYRSVLPKRGWRNCTKLGYSKLHRWLPFRDRFYDYFPNRRIFDRSRLWISIATSRSMLTYALMSQSIVREQIDTVKTNPRMTRRENYRGSTSLPLLLQASSIRRALCGRIRGSSFMRNSETSAWRISVPARKIWTRESWWVPNLN